MQERRGKNGKRIKTTVAYAQESSFSAACFSGQRTCLQRCFGGSCIAAVDRRSVGAWWLRVVCPFRISLRFAASLVVFPPRLCLCSVVPAFAPLRLVALASFALPGVGVSCPARAPLLMLLVVLPIHARNLAYAAVEFLAPDRCRLAAAAPPVALARPSAPRAQFREHHDNNSHRYPWSLFAMHSWFTAWTSRADRAGLSMPWQGPLRSSLRQLRRRASSELPRDRRSTNRCLATP